MANTSVRVSLEVADGAAQKALQSFTTNAKAADAALGHLGDSSNGVFGKLGIDISAAHSAFEIFEGTLAAEVALKAIEVLAEAAKKLFEVFVVEGVKAAEKYEVALNQLDVSLASSGKYSAEASKGFEEFAAKIQETTRYSDDAVLSGASLLESMARLDKDGLRRASQASIDLAAALHLDLASAFELVGKASEGNVTALKKHGLVVEKGADDAKTFANALQLIEDRFGGTAVAQSLTYAGGIDKASHAFEDLQKAIGQVITDNPVIKAAIQEATAVLFTWTEAIKENKSGLIELVAKGFLALIEGANYVVSAFDLLVRSGNYVVEVLTAAFAELGTILLAPFSLFSSKAKEVFDAFVLTAIDAAKKADSAFTETTGLSKLSDTLATIQVKSEVAFNSLSDGADKAAPSIKNAAKEAAGLTEAQTLLIAAGEKLGKQLSEQAQLGQQAYKETTESAKAALEGQLAALNTNKDASHAISQDFIDKETRAYTEYYSVLSDARDKQYADDQTALEAAFAHGKLTRTQYRASIQQLDKNQALEEAKADADELKSKKKLKDDELELEKYYVTTSATIAGNLATLMNTKNRELFEIGKAASIAQATINTYQGATKALAEGGPLGIILAASVIAAGLVQVSAIASTDYKYANGGVVGNAFIGATAGGDNVTASLRTGEMVLNADQQRKLFDIANGGAGGTDQVSALASAVAEMASQPIVLNIDGKEFASITRNQSRLGRTFT
jgi:hypothetical protein